ncbi:MAG: hypothetical protein M0R33_15050 [Methylomonas sp.]|uniref:hypothetical protein n=1 Tax=Methylomonas sp. TaxID=418 RepID=UPI0025E5268E|nr:hypothetical protein [Methylomonas sp.]MCK9607758.1 hypothetical protein [Methylomonas sp.]
MAIHQGIIRPPSALASRRHSDMAADGRVEVGVMAEVGVMVEAGVTAAAGAIEVAGDAEDTSETSMLNRYGLYEGMNLGHW